MEYIVSVLDFYSNSVDIFSVTVPEEESDYDVYIQDTVEDRGHHITDCHYMFTEAKKFELNVGNNMKIYFVTPYYHINNMYGANLKKEL